MARILLYGLSTFKNKGCEAIVSTTLNQFNDNDEVTIATFDYDHDKSYFKNKVKKYVRHYENDESKFNEKETKLNEYYKSIQYDYNNFELLYQRKVVEEIKKSDYCLHVGGDNYCYGYNEWLYALNTLAKKYHKKTILWCASLFDHIDDPTLIEDLNKYNLIILREKSSYNAVKKYIPEEKLMLAPDPAFALNKKEIKLNEWYKDNTDIIGLNFSPLTIKSEEDYSIIKNYIEYLLSSTKLGILLIPHVTANSSNDLDILNRIKIDFKKEKRVFLESDKYNCEETKYIISKCKYIVTARTHVSIASYSLNIPTLVIGYSIKSIALSDLIFGEHNNTVVDSKHLSLEKLINKTNYMFENEKKLRNILNRKCKKLIEDSKIVFLKAISQISKNELARVVAKQNCCGCMACLNICPSKAIAIVSDEYGFEYPVIDQKLCTNCGACKKICPVLNKDEANIFKPICYAAKANENKVKLGSSSGGIFYYLAKHILSNNGVVYGAAMENLHTKHIRIDDINDLTKIQKSKYTQSTIKDTFKFVVRDLKDNKKVLFCGTPCQIAAIKRFVKTNTNNLICVSIVCHGVTSNYSLNKMVNELDLDYNCKIKTVDFRSKINGWEEFEIKYGYDNGSISFSHKQDPMMQLYLKNYNLRESCYNCSFKGTKNNKADLILGDYWGIYNYHKDFFDNNGVSSVIILSNKGKSIFENIKTEISLIPTKLEYIKKHNPSFELSVKKPNDNLYVIEKLKNNTIKLVVEQINYKNEIDKIISLEEENKKIYKEYESLNDLNKSLQEKNRENELLINSKRVKIINKLFLPIDKLRRMK